MSISSTASNSSMQQMMQMQQTQRPPAPSSTNLVSQIMESNDIDGSDSLTIEELGLSQEDFTSFDTDSDGFLSSSELEETLSSKLESMKNQELTPESFASFLSEMGVEVPSPPTQGKIPNAAQIAQDIFSSKSTNENGLITIDELGVSEELFSTLDIDSDGAISQEELEESLTALFDSVESGDTTKEAAGAVLSTLGVAPPGSDSGEVDGSGTQASNGEAGGVPPAGGGAGAGGGSSSEEEYDEADTNQDGYVSAAEQAAYDGTTDETSQDYALKLVSSLLEALKIEDMSNAEDMDLSKFKSVMSMINNQTQDSSTADKLNTYVSNLDLGLKTA